MSANYPCSICDFVFGNPRELGNHILTAHCNDTAGNAGGSSINNEEGDNKNNIKLLAASSKVAASTSTTSTLNHRINKQGDRVYDIILTRFIVFLLSIFH